MAFSAASSEQESGTTSSNIEIPQMVRPALLIFMAVNKQGDDHRGLATVALASGDRIKRSGVTASDNVARYSTSTSRAGRPGLPAENCPFDLRPFRFMPFSRRYTVPVIVP